jgi:glycine/D-amino acid oxidase-like deaminating enzyme
MATTSGIELEAKALVFATGYELAHGVPSGGHRRSSTFAFTTPPQPQRLWSNRELIWEAASPYLYMRTTTDGRVVVGGEDEDFDDERLRDAHLPAKVQALQAKVKRLFPQLDTAVDFAWAGTFGESATGLPTIGAIPDMPNCHAVLGYGGNGFTFGMIAAQVITASLLDRPILMPTCLALGRRNKQYRPLGRHCRIIAYRARPAVAVFARGLTS